MTSEDSRLPSSVYDWLKQISLETQPMRHVRNEKKLGRVNFRGLCIKTRLSGQPLIWKGFFILMQIKLIFTRLDMHLASLKVRVFGTQMWPILRWLRRLRTKLQILPTPLSHNSRTEWSDWGERRRFSLLTFAFTFSAPPPLPCPFGACHVSYQPEQGIQYNSLPDWLF